MAGRKKLLVIQVAALGHELLRRNAGDTWLGLNFAPLEPEFPALTCTAQATFRTALAAESHGVVGNGFLDRALRRPFFWEQAASLVRGERIWHAFRRNGGTVGLMFWQQSMGEDADLILSPAPIHKHHGGMIEDAYAQPSWLYPALCERVGGSFALRHYWGPLASNASSRWIAKAVCHVLRDAALAPDLLLAYLPVLDYDLQRHGPDGPPARRAFAQLAGSLGLLLDTASACGYERLVFGDYAIGPVPSGAVLPNRILREAGLLEPRPVDGRLYPDLHRSRAFALADHEIAHVYLPHPEDADTVAALFRDRPGIARVLAAPSAGLRHERAGDLVLVAAEGFWFAYPWWDRRSEAPEYAGHVDIHNKPGYDPCELFFGWPPGRVSRNLARVRGSHGRIETHRAACWASSFLAPAARSLRDLAGTVRDWLNDGSQGRT